MKQESGKLLHKRRNKSAFNRLLMCLVDTTMITMTLASLKYAILMTCYTNRNPYLTLFRSHPPKIFFKTKRTSALAKRIELRNQTLCLLKFIIFTFRAESYFKGSEKGMSNYTFNRYYVN